MPQVGQSEQDLSFLELPNGMLKRKYMLSSI